MENRSTAANNVDNAKYHAWFHHNGADGWITVAKKTPAGKFRQYHYRPEDLAEQLGTWLGEDVYFSQNTFFKPQRSIENIRQLRSLYVDLDFYLFNYEPSWILGKLEHEFFGESLPDPNILIFSGQGIVLIWLLDPVPYKALPLWQAVQNYFLELLKELGGDERAADASRVFRIAGSVNSKNGAEVRAEYRHDYRYQLRDIQYDYLPDLTEELKPAPGTKKRGRKKKVAQLFNTYKLHYARLLDLVKLVELRNYEVTGYRETICFLYRYWSCCYTNDPSEALDQTYTFNLQFSAPLPLKEVERATRSAEKAWIAKNDKKANELAIEKGYPGAGYNISNKKLISWLDITDDEMEHLQTIIGANEKKRRKRIANMEKRREEGMKPREEYLQEQRDKTQDKLFLLQQALKRYPNATQKELAEKLGVDRSYIAKLKRKLKV
ncbi:hypothetical protein J2S74_005410 [Evansella vedderi]|uniref:HTH cro/C1-type domain-containing protein n=1 Tax=Evansella vedderi TaxID=38282 RepID=A0ABU0A386_9BACI|nr:replication protein [Evansella vedderi]MDQ0257947.1 hypothetical protein [Evansella vedderi]